MNYSFFCLISPSTVKFKFFSLTSLWLKTFFFLRVLLTDWQQVRQNILLCSLRVWLEWGGGFISNLWRVPGQFETPAGWRGRVTGHQWYMLGIPQSGSCLMWAQIGSNHTRLLIYHQAWHVNGGLTVWSQHD